MDTEQSIKCQCEEINRYILRISIRLKRDPRLIWGEDKLYMRWIKKYARKWRNENK